MVTTNHILAPVTSRTNQGDTNQALQILVLAPPRSGTGYLSHLLTSLGYDVGHEVMGRNGTSNWLYVVDAPPPPGFVNVPGARSQHHFDKVIHLVRNPYTAIPSIAYTSTCFSWETPRKQGNYEATQYLIQHTHLPVTQNHFEFAALVFLKWHAMIQAQSPDCVVHMETALADLTGKLPFTPPAAVDTEKVNARPHAPGLAELRGLNAEIHQQLRDFCVTYGYDPEIPME